MTSARGHFDSVASEYETNRLGRWYIAHGEFIADRLAGRTFRTVLDIGCGTGWLLRTLVGRGIAERGIGLDASRRMVEEARARIPASVGANLQVHFGLWPELPRDLAEYLADEPVDLILCASTLHYFRDVPRALATCYETLEPGGSLLILERAPELSLVTRLWGRVHASILRDGVRFLGTNELLAALRVAGFDDVGVDAVLRRFFWEGKMVTSMALSSGRKSDTAASVSSAGQHDS